MDKVYQVTSCGRVLESGNLKQLLARAVSEKRNLEQTLRRFSRLQGPVFAQCIASRPAVAGRQ